MKQTPSFTDIVFNRFAAKEFTKQHVSAQNIDQLLISIKYAPSSYNLQPWRVIIIQDDKIKQQLVSATYNQPQIATCSHLFVFCTDTDLDARVKVLEQISPGLADRARTYLAGLTKTELLSWAQHQTYLALGNTLNGAKSLGFDSCPMEGFDRHAYSQILNIPKNLVPTVLCAVGYAKEKPGEKKRFSNDMLFDIR